MTRGLSRGAVAAVILAILAGLAVWGASFDDVTARPARVNGYVLGPDADESVEEYRERAARSLDALTGEEPTHALVAFDAELDPAEAEAALEGVDRVGAMVVGTFPPVPLPEPTAGHTRADVLAAGLETLTAELRSAGLDLPVEYVSAVVVYEDPATLRQLAARPDVGSVEAAPPDAAWGQFGVRPPAIAGANGEAATLAD